MARNYISDLGAAHPFSTGLAGAQTASSPWHSVMDGSFMLQGLLIAAGALLVSFRATRGRAWRAARVCFLVAGASLFVVGLAPEDVSPHLHLAAAAIHFITGGVALLLMGIAACAPSNRGRLPAAASLLAGTVMLLATAVLGSHNRLSAALHAAWGTGAIERAAAYPLPLWLTLVGIALLVRRGERVRS